MQVLSLRHGAFLLGRDAWSCRQAGEWRRRWGDRGNRGAATRGVEDAADEYTRSHHALALVLGTDIFFRNGAYRPETEEGRKILAHELTHVAQNKKREEYRGASREELEREAEAAEKQVEDSEERCQEIVFKGKKYKVSERRYKQVMDEVKNRVEYVAEHNTQGLDEEEYLKFLIAYRDMERNGEMIWQK